MTETVKRCDVSGYGGGMVEAEAFQIRTLAAKVMDEAWRRTTMAPLCPHCHEAILPEDVAGGVAQTGKKMVLARRGKPPQKP